MKRMIMSVALAALVASPALAQSARHAVRVAPYPAYAAQQPGYQPGYQAMPYAYGSGVIVEAGRYRGQDPDPNVQLQLRHDSIAED